jgi:hypothetical protein
MQEIPLLSITVERGRSNSSNNSKMQFKLKIWKYSNDFRVKKVILMSNNGIVKEKMLKNLFQWEQSSNMFCNLILEETKCEIPRAGKEILLVKTVKAILTIRVPKNWKQTNTISKIKILTLPYQSWIVNINKYKSKEN